MSDLQPVKYACIEGLPSHLIYRSHLFMLPSFTVSSATSLSSLPLLASHTQRQEEAEVEKAEGWGKEAQRAVSWGESKGEGVDKG